MRTQEKFKYPFKPKSNRYLIPGQFWGIPLNNGKFACGRVLEIDSDYTKGFIAGLMDWVGEQLPTSDELAECKIIAQGSVHIKTIRETGVDGNILGFRSLDIDDLEVAYFRSQEAFDENCMLQKGYKEIRPITKEEWGQYDTFSTWGYEVIRFVAEEYFGKK